MLCLGARTCRASPSVRLNKHFSTTTNNKLYEFRKYVVHPKDFPNFLTLTNNHIHLRTAASPLVGYWYTEIGYLNCVYHVWEYDSLSHRAKVRAALAKDDNWVQQYMVKAREMWVDQQNGIMKALVEKIQVPQKPGFYELIIFLGQLEPRPTATLVGLWEMVMAEGTPVSTKIALWHHESLDALPAENSSISSSLLIPTPFSPLQ